MSRGQRIQEAMESGLQPVHMELVDESHNHSVPAGSESHWNLLVVSEAFEGKFSVQRHRLVYAALGDELRSGLHALTLKTMTPVEWEAAGKDVSNPSPKCRGGSKSNA